MSNNLERICKVDVSIASPIASKTDFDNILILGRAPLNPDSVAVPRVGVYSSIDEVTDLGYVTMGTSAEPVGVAARVAFSQNPRPHCICIATISATPAVGEDEEGDAAVEAPMTLDDVLDLVGAYDGWYCICPVGLNAADTLKVIQWTETHNKICGYVDANPVNPIAATGLYMRSFAVYPKESMVQTDGFIPAENLYGIAVAFAVKAMSNHAGEETWAIKQLNAISPAQLSSVEINALTANNFNFVLNIGSKIVTQNGKTNAGEWIDVVRFRDWLQSDMQIRVVNLLAVNPKIPYTDNGIALVENQMIASLKDGQKYGGIALTEYDADDKPVAGFTTSVPLAAELSSAQKASRVLEDCRFTARLAGAIHLVEISGCLTYEKL